MKEDCITANILLYALNEKDLYASFKHYELLGRKELEEKDMKIYLVQNIDNCSGYFAPQIKVSYESGDEEISGAAFDAVEKFTDMVNSSSLLYRNGWKQFGDNNTDDGFHINNAMIQIDWHSLKSILYNNELYVLAKFEPIFGNKELKIEIFEELVEDYSLEFKNPQDYMFITLYDHSVSLNEDMIGFYNTISAEEDKKILQQLFKQSSSQ